MAGLRQDNNLTSNKHKRKFFWRFGSFVEVSDGKPTAKKKKHASN